jgi:hypothetical protein
VIRNRHRNWWLTYNYVTSAALDAGLALCTLLIFFALILPKVDPPKWWGNNVVETTMVSLIMNPHPIDDGMTELHP